MMTVLLIAVAAQWGLLVLLALLNVALFRQVGLLHMRISPVGALTLPGGVAVGADGLIIEVHDQPDRALSDGAQALTLEQYDQLVNEVRAIREAIAPAHVG